MRCEKCNKEFERKREYQICCDECLNYIMNPCDAHLDYDDGSMAMCVKEQGHKGKHKAINGDEW